MQHGTAATSSPATDEVIQDALERAGVDLSTVRNIPLEQIQPGRFQPRKHFDEEALKSLAAKIRRDGQAETAIVNDLGDGKFELIAGERRWRACKIAKKKTLRAIVVQIDDINLIARLAFASNDGRVDLNALDQLEACLEMRNKHGMSDGQIAEAMDQSVQWVSNTFTLDRLHGKLRPLLGSTGKGGFSRSVGLELIRLDLGGQIAAMKRIRAGKFGQKRARRIVEEMQADGANPHPDAQDRRTPTDSFLRLVRGGCETARDAMRRLTTGSRLKKLGELDSTQLRDIRGHLGEVEAALSTLREALPK